jgi:hypothetical protein
MGGEKWSERLGTPWCCLSRHKGSCCQPTDIESPDHWRSPVSHPAGFPYLMGLVSLLGLLVAAALTAIPALIGSRRPVAPGAQDRGGVITAENTPAQGPAERAG